ncbi:MAG: hypothetical protein R3281_04865 [Balneolaceae bacterium]|nr:hypothetical protein [Balneolaceae bacterium]
MRYCNITVSLILVLVAITCSPSNAQVAIGGLADFELRKGGPDSDATVNQTPNDKWMVYTPTIRLFIDASLSDRWYVSGALQSDYYTGRRSDIFVSSFNLNWMPSEQVTVTAGRFITPFGRAEELILSSQHSFVHMPLSHVWNMPVDRKRGYVFSATSYDDVPGQAMVYQRLYSQGVMLGGVTKRETFRYRLAATLTSVSSYADLGQHVRPAIVADLEVRPVIWNRTGLSYANGPYMVDDPVNDILNDSRLSAYLQQIISVYTEFSHSYYQLLFQFTFNRWDSPWIDRSGNLVEDDIENNVSHYMAQAKVRFPFWVGGYGAIRYEQFLPGEITLKSRNITGQPTPDKQRLEMVLGYKLKRNITLKASYLLSRNDGSELRDDVAAIQISAGF